VNKVVASEMISLDGYFAGPDGELDWHYVDDEFNAYATELLDAASVLVFGRVTYQLMADFWPSDQAQQVDPETALRMNRLPKVVFSRSMKRAEWAPTEVKSGDLGAEIDRLRQGAVGNVLVLGSGQILSALAELGLVDEYRLLVNPIVLGQGRPLFSGLKSRLPMKLVRTRPFKSGLMGLFYEPDRT